MTIVHTSVMMRAVGSKMELTEDFRISVDGVDYVIPRGYRWDGASVPRPFWASFGHPFDQRHLVAGLFHDAAYDGVFGPIERKDADAMYRTLLRAHGVNIVQAYVEWAAVRACGGLHYKASLG